MSGATRQTGTDHLSFVEHLQYLACTVEIRTDIESFAKRLPYHAQHAEQDHPIVEHVVFDVAYEGNGYVIFEDAVAISRGLSSEIAFETLFKRIHERAFATIPNDIRIHAASGVCDGGLFLLVGNPMAGKTTLAMHLLHEGMDMVGDELVLLCNNLAVTFPRKFYPRESSFKLLPAMGDADLPLVYDADGIKRVAVDPTTFGRPWRIGRMPVRAVFYVEPGFGGGSKVSSCSKVDMVRLVTEQCLPPKSKRKDWIADVCNMVNYATTVRLLVGDLGSAALAVRRGLGLNV